MQQKVKEGAVWMMKGIRNGWCDLDFNETKEWEWLRWGCVGCCVMIVCDDDECDMGLMLWRLCDEIDVLWLCTIVKDECDECEVNGSVGLSLWCVLGWLN
jgi:hypothetical protein